MRRLAFGGCAWLRDSWIASLTKPDAPAAGSPWPCVAFPPPTATGLIPRRLETMPSMSEPNSIGSPRGVPVPWVSYEQIASAVRDASSMAAARSPDCALPFGAVRLALLPSERTRLRRSEAHGR